MYLLSWRQAFTGTPSYGKTVNVTDPSCDEKRILPPCSCLTMFYRADDIVIASFSHVELCSFYFYWRLPKCFSCSTNRSTICNRCKMMLCIIILISLILNGRTWKAIRSFSEIVNGYTCIYTIMRYVSSTWTLLIPMHGRFCTFVDSCVLLVCCDNASGINDKL